MSVNHSARSGGILGILFDFLQHEDIISLESLHGGDSYEYIQYTISPICKRKSPKIIRSLQVWDFGIFSNELKHEFKTSVVNEPSEFEPHKVYSIFKHS